MINMSMLYSVHTLPGARMCLVALHILKAFQQCQIVCLGSLCSAPFNLSFLPYLQSHITDAWQKVHTAKQKPSHPKICPDNSGSR